MNMILAILPLNRWKPYQLYEFFFLIAEKHSNIMNVSDYQLPFIQLHALKYAYAYKKGC